MEAAPPGSARLDLASRLPAAAAPMTYRYNLSGLRMLLWRADRTSSGQPPAAAAAASPTLPPAAAAAASPTLPPAARTPFQACWPSGSSHAAWPA